MLTLQRIEEIRWDCLADDLGINYERMKWTEERIPCTESGGTQQPPETVPPTIHASPRKKRGDDEEEAALQLALAESAAAAASAPDPKADSEGEAKCEAEVEEVISRDNLQEPRVDTAAACEPCTDVPSSAPLGAPSDDSSREAKWMEQDARLLTFLESASLLRLADSLRGLAR